MNDTPRVDFQHTKNGGKYLVILGGIVIKAFRYKNHDWQKAHSDAENLRAELAAKLNEETVHD